MICESVVNTGRYPYVDATICAEFRDVRHCAYCNLGVCVRCTDPCFQCGEDLHDCCREDHEKQTGHLIDIPFLSEAAIDQLAKRIAGICKAAEQERAS